MGTDFNSIPIIDIAPLLAKCDDPEMVQDLDVCEVVKQLDQACREAAFFYVKGHGIPESLMENVRVLTRNFFELPYEEKLKIEFSPSTGYRGYQKIGENKSRGVPDIHETINVLGEVIQGMSSTRNIGKLMEGCNQWPESPENFKTIMEEYLTLCTELSRKIMRGIALALVGSPSEFEGRIAGIPWCAMRLLGYPGVSGENDKHVSENFIGSGAHTDYGLLALINQDDDITALQVRNKSGEWISAPPIHGTFVCNLGDMLKILSNGLYESTLHRVINNDRKYRVSVGCFYEPNLDAVVEPLEVCIEKTGGTKKFGRVVYGEHLLSMVTRLDFYGLGQIKESISAEQNY